MTPNPETERFTIPESVQTGVDPTELSPEEAKRQAEAIRIAELMKVYHIEPPWTSKQLDEAEIETEFLVDGILVRGQHAVIGGASKTMKTSIAIDLTLSLAKPSKFLGKFWVPQSQRVLFLSAESGEATIQETARRVAKSKGFQLADDDGVTWGFWVPRAKNSEQLSILDFQLDQSAATVAIIDPLYMVLDGEDQANLSMNGQQLQAVSQRCLERGVTPVLVDHVKRSSGNAANYQPLELTDVSGAGKAEFFRQWLLVSRREKFNPDDPIHQLWMGVGGSAGHCGLWAVNIDERRDESTESRTWGVTVESASEARAEDEATRQRKKAEEVERRDKQRLDVSVHKIRTKFTGSEPISKTQLKTLTALKPQPLADAIAFLIDRDELQLCRHKGKTGPEFDGFTWTKNATHRKGTRTQSKPSPEPGSEPG